jgi:hypothetical protein
MTLPKKKILGPIEIVTLLGLIILIGYITLKSGGGKVYERSESTQITNNPTGEGLEYSGRRPNKDLENQKVEDILRQISDQFGKENVVRTEVTESNTPQMSADELRYINDVRRQTEEETPPGKDINWFQILKASHKTYSKVKDVFQDAGIDISEAERGITSTLVNEAAERTIYNKMEEYFNIPADKTEAFARSGQRKISDWARFVDESKE